MKKRVLSLVLSVLTAAALAGCGSSDSAATATTTASTASGTESTAAAGTTGTESTESESTPTSGGTFVYGLATEVNNFDPFEGTTADAKSLYFNIYEGLTKVTEDGSFEPCLASDMQVSEDATTYTFTIRDGVKFHDGSDLDTADVLYSIQKAIDAGATGYDNIESFEATDDKTVVITLKTANTDFPADASMAIVPENSDENQELVLSPVGTGPYMLTDYEVQDHVTLSKNTDYWGDAPYLDTVEVKFIDSSADLLVNYQSGAIDGFTADASIATQVDEATSVLNVSNSNATQMLALNNAAAPFDDVRVRQAISYAVDSDEIINTVDYGYGTKIGTAMIPGLSKYFDDTLTNTYDVDVDKAKELLADAGYADGFTFTCKVPSVYQVHIDTAQVIVNQLAEIGVTMNIEQVDWATWLENVYTNRDYEATIISVDGAVASPTAFLDRYVSTADNNFVNFNSTDFDETYAQATSTTDDEERTSLMKASEKVITDEAASVYIQDIANILVYTNKFSGFKQYPLYAVDFSAIYQVQ